MGGATLHAPLRDPGAEAAAAMESAVDDRDWKKLSAEELMAKKDAIEAEMSACNTVLENVSDAAC